MCSNVPNVVNKTTIFLSGLHYFRFYEKLNLDLVSANSADGVFAGIYWFSYR